MEVVELIEGNAECLHDYVLEQSITCTEDGLGLFIPFPDEDGERGGRCFLLLHAHLELVQEVGSLLGYVPIVDGLRLLGFMLECILLLITL